MRANINKEKEEIKERQEAQERIKRNREDYEMQQKLAQELGSKSI